MFAANLPTDRTLERRIRRLAKQQELVAERRREMWYFADGRRILISPECGLDDEEALEFLQES
jgi:hypothetical protein